MALSRARQALCAMGLAAAAVYPAPARAAEECPPGDWFCDDETSASPPDAPELAPDPDQDAPAPSAAPPPPGMLPPKMDVTTPRSSSPSADTAQEAAPAFPTSPWSVSLRLQGVMLGSSDNDAALGGIGASLRYALNQHLVLDLGFDALGGTDYNGYERSETSLATSLLVYLNPDKIIRTYVLAGLHASSAQVDVYGDEQDWTYVGFHTGLGLDFPIHERVSLALDLVGFLRGRTDSRAAREPEFTDGFGNLSNTSGGALFRGAVALYW